MSVHIKKEEMKGKFLPSDLGLTYCSAERLELYGTVEIESKKPMWSQRGIWFRFRRAIIQIADVPVEDYIMCTAWCL